MRESTIQRHFTAQIKKHDGWARKFITTSCRGVPDFIACLNGSTFFVEFKAEGRKLRASQVREQDRMKACGANVYVVDSIEMADILVQFYLERQP